LSQTELANALDSRFQQVQKYENGTNRVGASRLAAARASARHLARMFFEDGEVPRRRPARVPAATVDAHIVAFMADSNAARLIQSWAGAPKDVRRASPIWSRPGGKTGGELA